ncbi:MAG TPA: LON peptidase substrate-binding domain-containing protein [Acetobacteraceae bacterium]|nr:LON peptidase substrate-binding domain-containing protein [Acetobacteraceae bacterium]
MPVPVHSLTDLPAEFPVFPLPGALLLPRTRLPLNIFEPRYLALVEDALGRGRLFGMIQPNPSQPDGPTGPALFAIGCLGRVIAFSETEDNRYLITLAGLIRFRVQAELPLKRGYRCIRADLVPFGADLAPTRPASGIAREPLLAALRAYLTVRGLGADWKTLDSLPEDRLVGTLSTLCPFAPTEKQALLEAPDETARGETLLALLKLNAHAPAGGSAEKAPLAS